MMHGQKNVKLYIQSLFFRKNVPLVSFCGKVWYSRSHQMKLRSMRIVCWMTKATNTHAA